ncbi:hypothetical protein C1H46_036915 [Malus baccata]|uniref:Response regulatory domain-containing protein n=1 Tax=Malus baccata TaxID=106549 RepID=A0A540KTM1_MALBA|nr:hypothetical protein C1H46_036915 [Malus baccata]
MFLLLMIGIIDRKLIERLLKTSSYQVTVVDSGSKALEFLRLHEQDYCMPGMTGYDLLRKIKESNVFKDIPVVIMSSENESSRINRCLEEGAEEFFVKPMQLSDMNKLRPHMWKGRSSMDMEDQSNFNKREQEQNIMT